MLMALYYVNLLISFFRGMCVGMCLEVRGQLGVVLSFTMWVLGTKSGLGDKHLYSPSSLASSEGYFLTWQVLNVETWLLSLYTKKQNSALLP